MHSSMLKSLTRWMRLTSVGGLTEQLAGGRAFIHSVHAEGRGNR